MRPVLIFCYHKLSGLKHHNFITLQLYWSEIQWAYLQNEGVSQAFFLWRLWGESVFLPFPVSRGHLHSLACDPFIFKLVTSC